MRTRVVGVTFSNDDGSSRTRIIGSMTESDQVCFERDPYNPYDSNAVKVCVIKDGEKKQIGFLPKDEAACVSPKLRMKIRYTILVVGVGLWNDRPFCEIEYNEASPEQPTSEPIVSSPTIRHGPIFTPHKSKSQS